MYCRICFEHDCGIVHPGGSWEKKSPRKEKKKVEVKEVKTPRPSSSVQLRLF